MNKDIKNKLRSYALLAGGTLTGSVANADIIYTNIDPDSTLSMDQDFIIIDIDNNSTPDFRIDFMTTASSSISFYYKRFAKARGLNSASLVASSGPGPAVMAKGEPVSYQATGSRYWVDSFSEFGNLGSYTYRDYMGFSTNKIVNGNWPGETNKYLGIRLKVGLDSLYGWIRLSVDDSMKTLTVKDYAYESIPGKSIEAGARQAEAVSGSSIVLSDVGDNGNASDIRIRFNKLADESVIARYDVFLVKATEASGFDLQAANSASLLGHAEFVPKTGSNIDITLSANTVDKNGDPIQVGVAYRAFVLTVANGANTTINNLSSQSNSVTLQSIPLTGTVFLGSTSDTVKVGIVQLIRKNPDLGQFPIVGQSFINEDGSYTFPSVLPNVEYFLLAIADEGIYPNSNQTYNGNVANWQKAPTITASVGSSGLTEDIIVNNVVSAPSGAGTISGRIVRGEGFGKVQGPGDPLNGLDVSLIDKSTSSPALGGQESNQNGMFNFSGLDDGEYSIYVNIPGIPIDTNYTVNVSAGQSSQGLVKVTVDSNYISFEDATGIKVYGAKDHPSLAIYPNPISSRADISYELKQNADVKLELKDIEGRQIAILIDERQAKGQHTVNIDATRYNMPSGNYFIVININGLVERKQLIKIN